MCTLCTILYSIYYAGYHERTIIITNLIITTKNAVTCGSTVASHSFIIGLNKLCAKEITF